MKKYYYIIISILIMFIVFDNVQADKWKCSYKGNEGKIKLTYEFDNENNKMSIVNEEKDSKSTYYNYASHVSKDEFKYLNKNECPIIHLAKIHESDSSGYDPDTGAGHIDYYYYYSYSDSYLREQRPECVNGRDNIFDSKCIKKGIEDFLTISYTSINYYSLTLDKDNSINDDKTQINYCYSYTRLITKLREKYEEYSKNNNAQAIIESNKIIEDISSTCRSMFAYRDYSIEDSNGTLFQDGCILSCLSYHEEIKTLKEQYGIETKSTTDQCGFSQKLILWIANIVKWIKYIIPVIVIVLGILDFIKAIASEKDDEMKKAQGSFVKRLIAAALIFIIPFIIEFILDKMGFATNGCGIIDL